MTIRCTTYNIVRNRWWNFQLTCNGLSQAHSQWWRGWGKASSKFPFLKNFMSHWLCTFLYFSPIMGLLPLWTVLAPSVTWMTTGLCCPLDCLCPCICVQSDQFDVSDVLDLMTNVWSSNIAPVYSSNLERVWVINIMRATIAEKEKGSWKDVKNGRRGYSFL